jgi:glycosyltransferase involved in cell wall biosynthesis
MNILILNWRDIKNPSGGGAEILTHELAKGWKNKGHHVTQFSSCFYRSKKEDTLDGVKIIRRGHWWTVHLYAFFYYLRKKNNYDIVIDEVHWFPFFAKLYAPKKTIALTCETATKLFPRIFPPVISYAFQLLEKLYFLIYKTVPTMTISESTKKDLIKEGVKKDLITVLPMGVTIPKNLKKYDKEKNPTFIYLARLNKQKGIYDVISAFAIINRATPNSKLWIVGTGEKNFVDEAKSLVKKYGLEKNIKFFGFVDESKKFELLARAHILLVPSLHEGWGLTVPEASAVGTPSIVYNVAGLRDIARNTKSVVVLKNNSPSEMAASALEILNNNKLYKQLQNSVDSEWLTTWDKTSEVALKVIKAIYT